jgi:hypothetical protein
MESYRDTGFYWVVVKDDPNHDWTPGYYYGADSTWTIVGTQRQFADEQLLTVGPEISEPGRGL